MISILNMFHNLPPVVEQVANSLSPILYGPNVFVIFFPFPSRIRGLLGGTEKDSWKIILVLVEIRYGNGVCVESDEHS